MVKIGLEVHATINKLNSKLFCGCSMPDNDSLPNTHTCPVCLGHPGSKPVLNKKAFEYSLKLALALKCKISNQLVFSRKTYFYPDLAKNYQITQYELPLGSDGFIMLDSGKKVRIERIHMEEDPGAIIRSPGFVLVDYNRSGIPLCEIVTDPDMTTPDEAREFLNKLQTIIDYLDIFDPDTGVIKADANVSIEGGERVEIKNITGFKEIERAITYEIERHQSLDLPPQSLETRGWDAEKGITVFQRSKEGEADYGYIIDPDLVPTDITASLIRDAEKDLPELPDELFKKWTEKLNVDAGDARMLSNNPSLAKIFSEVSKEIDPVLAAKWIRRELSRVLNYAKKELTDTDITSEHLIDLLTLVQEKKITDQNAKKLLEMLVEDMFDVKSKVEELGLKVVHNTKELTKFCEEAVKEAPQAVADYKNGKENSINFIVGLVMKKTRGQAQPDAVKEIILNIIK